MSAVTIRFAGDSGDGLQIMGEQFADVSALIGNDISTLPNFPAEIRAPQGTLPGVSSFQIQFADKDIFTPGDDLDILVAMNPAALKANIKDLKQGGVALLNETTFVKRHLEKARYTTNPLEDGSLEGYRVIRLPFSDAVQGLLKESGLEKKYIDRCKNFMALGAVYWLYNRPLSSTEDWIKAKFAKNAQLAEANIAALRAGGNMMANAEEVPVQESVPPATMLSGTYRKISGNEALALGLTTAAYYMSRSLFYGSYPITPASGILHELAKHKSFGVKTFQAEDEIAAVAAAIGASYAGGIGVCGTSGPGMCLKAEAMGLAVMAELPLVVVDVQRAGPSTGMPTKFEQSDLLQAMYGRHGEAPVIILAPRSPSDCFEMAVEAVYLTIKHMTPVILLTDGFLGNSSEPWRLPNMTKIHQRMVSLAAEVANKPTNMFVNEDTGVLSPVLPFKRDSLGARSWIVPGMKGMEHRIGGLAKEEETGNVCYDPDNNQRMIELRAEKIKGVSFTQQENPQMPDTVAYPDGLVLSWGSTYGVVHQTVVELAKEGVELAHYHLKYLNPMPDLMSFFDLDRIFIPEMNSGHLSTLVKSQFPDLADLVIPLTKITGQPFKVSELKERIKETYKPFWETKARSLQ